jgi:hypothetical protein
MGAAPLGVDPILRTLGLRGLNPNPSWFEP